MGSAALRSVLGLKSLVYQSEPGAVSHRELSWRSERREWTGEISFQSQEAADIGQHLIFQS